MEGIRRDLTRCPLTGHVYEGTLSLDRTKVAVKTIHASLPVKNLSSVFRGKYAPGRNYVSRFSEFPPISASVSGWSFLRGRREMHLITCRMNCRSAALGECWMQCEHWNDTTPHAACRDREGIILLT